MEKLKQLNKELQDIQSTLEEDRNFRLSEQLQNIIDEISNLVEARVSPKVGEQYTNPETLPRDIKHKLIKIREALVRNELDEAYHILYSIASPNFDKIQTWDALEKD